MPLCRLPPWVALFALSLAGVAAFAAVETPEERGYQVAARADRADRGFGDSRVTLTMILRNAAGAEATRTLELRTLERAAESVGDKSLIVFHSPGDIAGTLLLSHVHILDPDDQWLYLPALRRTRRIASVNKSGPFVGSEFAFEDITGQELDKYAYRHLGEEPCAPLRCDVIERLPRYEHSGYRRQVAWIDQTAFQPRRIDYFDRKGELLKTQTFADYRLYAGRYWRPQTVRMINHQTGKSTDLLFSGYAFGTGLGEGDFVKGVLRRVR